MPKTVNAASSWHVTYKPLVSHNKAKRFRKRGKRKLTKFRNLSESHCEDALEILREIVAADVSLL